ncbi:MAG: rRNA maturation RNase YbeY [Tenericutes bacterium]|nr:rRNA maturation RNase YbeY [Mycoplasmatota bacterium]
MIKVNYINQYDSNKKYKKIIKYILSKGYKDLQLQEQMIISIVLMDNQGVQELNKQYRNIDKPTDVLSFENDSDIYEIGDIFISIDKIIEQAKSLKHSFEFELAYIAVHGFLHCLGYNHIIDADEKEMTKKQNLIMIGSKITR